MTDENKERLRTKREAKESFLEINVSLFRLFYYNEGPYWLFVSTSSSLVFLMPSSLSSDGSLSHRSLDESLLGST